MPDRIAICRLLASASIPEWAVAGSGFCSVTRTPDELSIVWAENAVPPGVKHDPGWRIFRVEGPFDFSVVGVLASVAAPPAEAAVPIFALSTFDTDYVLVKESDVERAAVALEGAEHQVTS